jgi:hypothetical protein
MNDQTTNGDASTQKLCWATFRRLLMTPPGILLIVALLIGTFYTFENWRGKRKWENYKRELQAKGEYQDWDDFNRPTISADQNFYEAPFMRQWFAKRSGETAGALPIQWPEDDGTWTSLRGTEPFIYERKKKIYTKTAHKKGFHG